MSQEPMPISKTVLEVEHQNNAVKIDEDAVIRPGKGRFDLAVEFLSLHEEAHGAYTEAEARRTLWKIDCIIMPLMTITVLVNSIDKGIISNATLYGMTEDCHLVGQDYSWVASIFYFGYLVAEVPANLLIQKLPIGKLLGVACMLWAATIMLMAACTNAGGLLALRFFMGAFEAPTFPVCAVMTVMWYRSSEQPLRTSIWIGSWSTIFSGIIAYGFGHTNTAIARWRLMFLVLGAFSFLWGVFLFFFLADSPVSASFLSSREKFIAIHRIKDNMTGIENKTIKWPQIRDAFLDWKTWPLAAFAFLIQICTGALANFAAQIVSGLGFSALETTLLGIPTGVIINLAAIIVSQPAARLKNMRCVTIIISLFVPLASGVLIMKLPPSNQNGRLAAYYCFYIYYAGYPTALSIYMANTSGHSKKLARNAIMFIAYCIGNLVGPQFFITSEAPGYKTGFRAILSAIPLSMACLIIYAVGVHFENRRNASVVQGHDLSAARITEDENLDLTDREKKGFVYIY